MPHFIASRNLKLLPFTLVFCCLLSTAYAQKFTNWQFEVGYSFTQPRLREKSVEVSDPEFLRVYTNDRPTIKPGFTVNVVNTPSKYVAHVLRYGVVYIGGSQSFEVLESNISPRVPLVHNDYAGKNHQFSYQLRLQMNSLFEKWVRKQKLDSLRKWDLFLNFGLGASFLNAFSWQFDDPAANYTIAYNQNNIQGTITVENSTGLRTDVFGWFIPIDITYAYRINHRFSANASYFVQAPLRHWQTTALANRINLVNFNNGYSAQSLTDASSWVHGLRLSVAFHFNIGKRSKR